MELREEITRLVEEQLQGTDYFLVEVAVAGPKKVAKLTISVDGDEGIPIDACAAISRAVGNKIEQLDLIPAAYTLEVSSPGLDQPLRLLRQYRKNIGRMVKVHLRGGEIRKGTLEVVGAEAITIREAPAAKKKTPEPLPVTIALTEVDKTYVLPAFDS